MFNLPNILTLSRIILVILFTVVLAVGEVSVTCIDEIKESNGYWFQPISVTAAIALWSFVIAAITDFFDGYLARKYNLITDFGKLIDPLADKILVSAAFIYLTSVNLCPFWVTIVIIFREFLVTGLRQLAVTKGHVIAADWCGKWKTVFQLAFCIAALTPLAYGGNLPMPLNWMSIGIGGEWTRDIFMWGSVLLTLGSGLNYCLQARKFLT